jgi:hypothetical protein
MNRPTMKILGEIGPVNIIYIEIARGTISKKQQ